MKRMFDWFLVMGLVIALVLSACAAPKPPAPATERPVAERPAAPKVELPREWFWFIGRPFLSKRNTCMNITSGTIGEDLNGAF